MSKSDAHENAYLNLLFKNIDFANIGDAGGLRGSVTPGNLYIALYTADPGDAGTAPTNETAYTGYARKALVRGAGWTVTGNSVSPASDQDFGECTASPGGPITNWGVVSSSSGAGILLYKGSCSPTITMQVGSIPRVKATSAVTED